MSDLSGSMIGRYQIIARLGQGGMASVYRALDTRLEREVAIKTIRTDMFPPALLPDILARFEREAKALARLDHPNIVRVHDYGEHENVPYLVMTFVRGGSLKEQTGRRYSPTQAAALLAPVARALEYAHSLGILHRDIKPANILIDAHGIPLLSDFGIAKILDADSSDGLTATGMAIGTPEYMAPEQSSGEKVDARADIYALGVVLFELLSGRRPFEGNTPIDVMIKTRTAPIPSLSSLGVQVLPEVEVIVQRALARETGERYATMGAFAQDLESLLHDSAPTGAVKAPAPEPEPLPALQQGAVEEKTITTPTPLPPAPASPDSGRTITTPPVPVIESDAVTAAVTAAEKEAAAPQPPASRTPPPPAAVTPPPRPPDRQAPGKRASRGLPPWAYGLIAFVLILLIGGGIWAASRPGTAPEPTAAVVNTEALRPVEPVHIIIWDTWSDDLEMNAIRALLDEYQGTVPGLTIEYLKPADQDILAAINAGTGPDILLTSNEHLGSLAEGLIPVSREGVTPASLRGRFSAAAVASVIWQDQIWGIPFTQKALAIVYNRDLVTPLDFPTDPNDLDGLVKKAYDFQRRTGKSMVCLPNLNSEQGDSYFAAPFFFTVGMPGYINEAGEVFASTQAGREGGRLLKAWRLTAGPQETSYDLCKELFFSGQVGAWWIGPWEKVLFEGSDLKLGVAHFGRPFVTTGTAALTRSAADRKHLPQAVELINFLSRPESQVHMALTAHAIPVSDAAASSPELRENALIAGFYQAAAPAIPILPSPLTQAQWGPMAEAVRLIWSGEQPPAEALAAAQKQIEEAVARMK